MAETSPQLELSWEESFIGERNANTGRAVKLKKSKKIVVKKTLSNRRSFNVLRRCQECGKNFGTKFALNQHLSVEHQAATKKGPSGKKSLRHCCKTCGIRFRSTKLLNNHVTVAHGPRTNLNEGTSSEFKSGTLGINQPGPVCSKEYNIIARGLCSEIFGHGTTFIDEFKMNPVMVAKKMDDIPINFVEQSECKHKRNNFRKRKISDELVGNPSKRSNFLEVKY